MAIMSSFFEYAKMITRVLLSLALFVAYQFNKATIFMFLPLVAVSPHIIVSVVIWKRLAGRRALLALVALSIFSYALTWGMTLVSIILSVFGGQPVVLPEVEFAHTIFTFILNPCGIFPWMTDLFGEFVCNSAIVWFGPTFFFVLGLLPALFLRAFRRTIKERE